MSEVPSAVRAQIRAERGARLGTDPVFLVTRATSGARRPHDWFESRRQAESAAVTLVDGRVVEAPR